MRAAIDSVRSPTRALLAGLAITLATVVGYSLFFIFEIKGLEDLQRELTDRNRRESLQLLRIQNDLNQLALAMRDMLDDASGYPLTAWTSQFDRVRRDLDDALRLQAEIAAARETALAAPVTAQQEQLSGALQQFWTAVDRMFALAATGNETEASAQIALSLQARQASIATLVARLLVQNNATEAATAARVQDVYARVQRQAYWFLAVALLAIGATSLYLIRANRHLFAQLAALSEERKSLAQTLISTRESTLREIARELHDEFGQLLTAMGSMLGRALRRVDAASPLAADLQEVRDVTQTALESVRGLAQSLHPAILEQAGLDAAIDWYLSTAERQLGITVTRQRSADANSAMAIPHEIGIHVYRVLQEALSNVARHAGTRAATVRLLVEHATLVLEIEDNGCGFEPVEATRGLGLVAMRERAALMGGRAEFRQPAAGGTLVRLTVPLNTHAAHTRPAG